MKTALAQINPVVGDFEYNTGKILSNIELAVKHGADLIVFPELVLCGYFPKDLLLKKQFIEDNKKYLKKIISICKSNIYVMIGFAEENQASGKPLFNSLALIHSGKLICTSQKILLPTYDVFDEDRYFEPGKSVHYEDFLGERVGLSICEDIWHEDLTRAKSRYNFDPISELAKHKINLLVNISSSPYFIDKPTLREEVLKRSAKKYNFPIVYVNQVGGNDELIFDGNSCVVNNNGEICLKLKSFQEDFSMVDSKQVNSIKLVQVAKIPEEEELLQAIVCGLKDYILKCNFKKVLIGLSGGVDSALVAALAVFALGKENVRAVFMPSRYTSKESYSDAKALSLNLGIEMLTILIEEPFKAFLNLLLPLWERSDSTLAEENIQSRIRGLILMALSNQSGALVLSTGNKSELAVGYCTLYGDMCGGLSVIADLPKSNVYKLANYINKRESKEIIPQNTISRAPTAELRPDQKDEDTLPPYKVLDKILNEYIEEHLPLSEMIKNGIPKETVKTVCNMIDKSEYKRHQAAPGLKLTNRSFGYGWRMPIAQRYKEEA